MATQVHCGALSPISCNCMNLQCHCQMLALTGKGMTGHQPASSFLLRQRSRPQPLRSRCAMCSGASTASRCCCLGARSPFRCAATSYFKRGPSLRLPKQRPDHFDVQNYHAAAVLVPVDPAVEESGQPSFRGCSPKSHGQLFIPMSTHGATAYSPAHESQRPVCCAAGNACVQGQQGQPADRHAGGCARPGPAGRQLRVQHLGALGRHGLPASGGARRAHRLWRHRCLHTFSGKLAYGWPAWLTVWDCPPLAWTLS